MADDTQRLYANKDVASETIGFADIVIGIYYIF